MTLPASVPRASLPDVLVVPNPIARELLDHARVELPNEACGLLSGFLATGRVTRFHPARNALGSPWRFELAPDDLVRIVLGIEEAGEELVAVFHSHSRTDAVPSPTDIRELRYPALLLVAGSVAPGAFELRAWRVDGGEVAEARVIVA